MRRERKHMADIAARMRRPVPPTTTHYMTGRRVSAIAEMVVPTRWYRMEEQADGTRKRGGADTQRAFALIEYLLEPDSLLDTFLDRLKEFQGLTLNDFSSTQLKMLYEITEQMRANGRREMEALLNERRERRGSAIGGIVKEILRGEPQKVFENIGSLESKKEQRSGPVYSAQAASLRPSRMIRLFAGGIEGVFYEHFVNRVNKATDSEIREYKRRLNKGTEIMKELGISAKVLDKELEYDGVTMITDDVLHLWLAMMNERSERAVVYGNKIDRGTIHGLTAQLSPELKKWGMAILADFEGNYGRLNEAFIEDRNMDMGKEQAYFPMIRQDLDQMPLGDEFASQLAVRNAWRKGYADKKFTLSRVDINEANQKPIQLGATRLWLQQIEKQEHYIASQSLVKDLQYIADNRVLKDSLKQRYGRRANEWLLKYINAYAQPNMYKTFDATSRFMSVIRGNMAVAYLGFNLLTVFKQAPSLAFYLRNANPLDMLKAASEMVLHPLETMRFVNTMDPQMDMRSYDRVTEEPEDIGPVEGDKRHEEGRPGEHEADHVHGPRGHHDRMEGRVRARAQQAWLGGRGGARGPAGDAGDPAGRAGQGPRGDIPEQRGAQLVHYVQQPAQPDLEHVRVRHPQRDQAARVGEIGRHPGRDRRVRGDHSAARRVAHSGRSRGNSKGNDGAVVQKPAGRGAVPR